MADITIPAFIRGRTVRENLVRFDGRGASPSFLAPDPELLLADLPLRDPGALGELHALAFDEIVDFLARLGRHLDPDRNEFLAQALENSVHWSDMTAPLVRSAYAQLPALFAADTVREVADTAIGIDRLDGWVQLRMSDGRVAAIRAMGARAAHIIAGNSPLVAALTIVRNAIARSDAVIKLPSNDPLTALAIARTMAAIAPQHPITRHVSVAYWKGGSQEFERRLYRPAHLEKIVAWGGLASVRHITQYVQPGLELIALDPKRSATVIGADAFADTATLTEVARRAATDVGALNQLGCLNARVIYVASGTDAAGLARANQVGQLVYDQMQLLPAAVSTPAKRFDPELRAHLSALRTSPEYYRVIGGSRDEGAVIVSQLSEPVDFHTLLSGRVANIVPVDTPLDALKYVNAYTQTIGVYPESLKWQLRDKLALHGAQRLTSLGYAASGNTALPQDAIEPLRRMVRWIVDETCDTAKVTPLWSAMPEAHTPRVQGE